jgi:hypothetical protein
LGEGFCAAGRVAAVGPELPGFGAADEPDGAAEEPVGAADEPDGAAEEPVGAAEEQVGAAEEPVGAAEEQVGAADEPGGESETFCDGDCSGRGGEGGAARALAAAGVRGAVAA